MENENGKKELWNWKNWREQYGDRFSALMRQEVSYLSRLMVSIAEMDIESKSERFENIIDVAYIARHLAAVGRDINDLLGLTATEIEQMEAQDA